MCELWVSGVCFWGLGREREGAIVGNVMCIIAWFFYYF